MNNNANYFEILHLNMISLNNHIDSFSNSLSMMKLNFSIIGLSDHKITLILFSITSLYWVILFCYDETKSTHDGTSFDIADKLSYIKHNNQ